MSGHDRGEWVVGKELICLGKMAFRKNMSSSSRVGLLESLRDESRFPRRRGNIEWRDTNHIGY